ncbi:MAG: hypothetical protein P8P74_01345 [Crocinitomicaceae bacterium]|nr:hypothetical protein [Crocinitomicaceae bacterium]
MSKKHSIGWAIAAIFCGIFCIILFGYIDFEVITPMILPADLCYYHTHPTPYWVELLYMNGGSNGHPEGNFTHLFLIIALGAILGHWIVRTIRKNLASDTKDGGSNKMEDVLDEV